MFVACFFYDCKLNDIKIKMTQNAFLAYIKGDITYILRRFNLNMILGQFRPILSLMRKLVDVLE